MSINVLGIKRMKPGYLDNDVREGPLEIAQTVVLVYPINVDTQAVSPRNDRNRLDITSGGIETIIG